jgi:two-component system NarL family sensor kinase
VANDVSREPRYVAAPEVGFTRSEIAVPLLRDGELLGVLDIQSSKLDAFEPRDVDIIATLADQLAIALENAELFRQERQRRVEMGIILGASQAASASLVLDDVLQHVAEGISDAVGLPSCVIYLYDDEGARLLPAAFVAREGSRLDTARVSAYVPSHGATMAMLEVLGTQDAVEVRRKPERIDQEWADILAPTSALIVPFTVKQRPLGVAIVPAHEAGYRFAPAQLSIACGVASAAALALENARLYARSHTLGVAEERIRVAREIHDGIAQGLTAITLQLEAADQLFTKKPEKAREKIGRALTVARANMDDARRSVLDLRATALQELTLSEAMQRRMQQFNEQHRERGLVGECACGDLGGRLSARVELSLYRVYEEALDNVARHSGASRVSASLTRDGDWVTLTVRDNGHGFDVEQALSGALPLSGFGLVAIRERIRLLHGTFLVEAGDGPEPGTLLTATAPYESHIGERAEARTASIGYSSARSRAINQNGQGET